RISTLAGKPGLKQLRISTLAGKPGLKRLRISTLAGKRGLQRPRLSTLVDDCHLISDLCGSHEKKGCMW
ncbi:hypothetical protein, partial [Klebsiella grimontii]|uniref:hypothetical protein n=1 Tax=Klebsiella grimontii TaxID=2058152 RepID=UPI0015ABE5B0